MSKHFFTLSLLCCAQFLLAQVSPFIHLDQFGYWPDAEKVAVLSDPQVGFNAADSYSPASTLELRSASTDNVIYSGSPQTFNGGQTDASSGDRGWWFDFSSVSTPGSYYVYDPINDERSA
ncbi:MAG: cellulase N-terminal Ig-like domain-containing protein, partial [Bacteroidota bacterium]